MRLAHTAAFALASAAAWPGCAGQAVSSTNDALAGTPSDPLSGTQVVYFHAGLTAATELATDGQGQLAIERQYEPFGALLAGASASDEPLGGLGKPVDPATGLSDHGVRWFAPDEARWLTVDPIVRAPSQRFALAPWDRHPYQYARWQPTLYWDPDGRDLRVRGSRAGDLVEILSQASGLALARASDGSVSVTGARAGGGGSALAGFMLTAIIAQPGVHTYMEAKRSDPTILVGRPHARATHPGQYEVDVGDLDQLGSVIDPKLAQSAAVHEVFEAYLEGLENDWNGQPARHARSLVLENAVLVGLGAGFSRVGESNSDDGQGGGVFRADLGSFSLEVPFDSSGHGAFKKVP